MRRWPLVLLLVAVVLVGGRFVLLALNRTDDATQIRQALADAVKASKEGRPGSVIDKLSESFKVNEEHASFRQIADFVKNNHPDVDIEKSDPVVTGDTAEITSDVSVKLSFLGNSGSFTFKNAHLGFKKETEMDWLIFPTPKWHLSSVRVDPGDMPSLPIP